MAGSTYGSIFRVTTFGESHGTGIGAVIDGCPAGLSLDESFIQKYMDRRRPGVSKYATKRNESDTIEILSGVFEGRTEGTPIALLLRNNDQHSGDYSEIKDTYRPGHADFTFDEKYGFRDYRGGGRSSGRETAARVAAGAVAMKFLSELGIEIRACAKSIGPFSVPDELMDYNEALNNPLGIPDRSTYEKASGFLDSVAADHDSFGGIIECRIINLPIGLGEPVFDKFDAELSKAVMSIGAVKGFEMGDGFKAALSKGSENNDPFGIKDNKIVKETNHSGGTLGGMSDGSVVVFRAAVKPTPSIAIPQRTVTRDREEKELIIKGRHDPLVVPRAIVVVECMGALVTADMILRNMGSRMSAVKEFYR